MGGAEGGDLDHFAAETHMQQFEAATDQAAAPEQLDGLFRVGRSGDVEVLGFQASKQVTDAAAYQVTFMAGIFQPVNHFHRIVVQITTRDLVVLFGDAATPVLGGSGRGGCIGVGVSTAGALADQDPGDQGGSEHGNNYK